MATAPRNLSEYFASTGQKVPSLKERSIMFERAGLGSASNYMGSTEQNNRLLSNLFGTTKKPVINTSTGPKLPAPNGNVSASSTSSPSGPLGAIFGASKDDEGMNPDQMNIFNNKLMDILKSYQGLNTGDLQVRRNALVKAQNNRIAEITPDELRTLSPEQQAQIRGADAEAIGTDIDATNNLITKREAQYTNFGQILGAAQTFGESIAAQTRQHQQDIQQQIKDAVAISSSGAFVGIGEKEMSDLEKRSGMTKGALTGMLKALKAKEEQDQIDRDLEREQMRASIASSNRANRGPAAGTLSVLDGMGDPLTYFTAPKSVGGLGGKRVQDSNGGYSFFDANGTPITVEQAAASVPGATKDVFLEGSKNSQDAQYALSKGMRSDVQTIANGFDNEAIAKTYNKVNEGYQTIKTIGADTSSPTDDIAFIYAFAKIMDPESVVREGEYDTVQKYAQNWSQKYGMNIKRMAKNQSFLSKDAKQKMLKSLEPKVNTIKTQYNNLYNEYGRRIDNLTGGTNGLSYLTNYGKAIPESGGGNTQTMSDGSVWRQNSDGSFTRVR